MELAEAMALTRGNGNEGMGGMWNNPFVYLIWLAFFGGGFGNGFGGNRDIATASEVRQVNDNQTLMGKLNAIGSGICDSAYAINNAVKDTGYGIARDVVGGFNTIGAAVTQLGYGQQQCCCETNRNIDELKYEGAKNTCAITTNATANTQLILDKLCQMQANAKDQRIADLQIQLQAAQLNLNNAAQTASIINALRPVPIPSYTVSSPYTSAITTCPYTS